jgi:hypothetical protein
MRGFLPFTVESSASGRCTVLAHNGMRFDLTDHSPPLVAIRTTLDRDNVPVVQLLGRNDPREQWTVLQEISRHPQDCSAAY